MASSGRPSPSGTGAGVRAYPWLRSGQWPNTAQNGPEWPTRSASFLSGRWPENGPPERHLASTSDTKRSKMDQNGTEKQKFILLGSPEGRRDPIGWPAVPAPREVVGIPFPWELVADSPHGNHNMARGSPSFLSRPNPVRSRRNEDRIRPGFCIPDFAGMTG